MPICVYAAENPFGDVVALEGEFFRTFLADMPAEYVKVYLYCQYIVSGRDSGCDSLKKLAVAVGQTLPEIKSALEYFAQTGLLKLVSEHPLVIEIRSVKNAAMLKHSEVPAMMTGFSDYFSALKTLVGGRELRPAEMEKARDWIEVYQMPQEVVLLAVQHGMMNMQHESKTVRSPFQYIEKIIRSWADSGIATPEAAERYLTIFELEHHRINEIMLHIGLKRMPSIEEVKLYEKWTQEWHMSHEAVLEACSETTKTATPSFAYLDKIVQGIYEKGKQSAGDARQALDRSNEERAFAQAVLEQMGMRSGGVTPKLLELLDISRQMGFSQDGMLYAAAEFAGKAYKSLDKYEQALDKWAECHAFTEAQMKQYELDLARYDAQLARVFEALSLRRAVTKADRLLYIDWIEKEGYSAEKILEAAGRVTAPAQKLKQLGEILAGKENKQQAAGFKQTAAHSYDARANRDYSNVFTSLDELEDEET